MPSSSLALQIPPRSGGSASAPIATATSNLDQTAAVQVQIAPDVRFALYAGEGSSSSLLLATQNVRWVSAIRALWRLLYSHEMVVLRSNPSSWDQVQHALRKLAQSDAGRPTDGSSDTSIVVEQQVVHLFRLRWFPFIEWASPGVVELHLEASAKAGAVEAVLTHWTERSPATSGHVVEDSRRGRSSWRTRLARGPVLLTGWIMAWFVRPSPSYGLAFPSDRLLPAAEDTSTPSQSLEVQRNRPSLVTRIIQNAVGAACYLTLGVHLPLAHPLLGVCPRMFLRLPLVHRQATQERAAVYANKMGLPLPKVADPYSTAPSTPMVTGRAAASPALVSAREAPSSVAAGGNSPSIPALSLEENSAGIQEHMPAEKEGQPLDQGSNRSPASSSSKLPGKAFSERSCTPPAQEEKQAQVSIEVPSSPSATSPIKDSPPPLTKVPKQGADSKPVERKSPLAFQKQDANDWVPRVPLGSKDERILAYIHSSPPPVQKSQERVDKDIYAGAVRVKSFPRLAILGPSNESVEERGVFGPSSGKMPVVHPAFSTPASSTFSPVSAPLPLTGSASVFGPSCSLPSGTSDGTFAPSASGSHSGTFSPAAGTRHDAVSASNSVDAGGVFSPAAQSTSKLWETPAPTEQSQPIASSTPSPQCNAADLSETEVPIPVPVPSSPTAQEVPGTLFGPSSSLPGRSDETEGTPSDEPQSSLFGPSCAPPSPVTTDTTFKPAATGSGATFLPASGLAVRHNSFHTVLTATDATLAPAAATPPRVFGRDLDPIPAEAVALVDEPQQDKPEEATESMAQTVEQGLDAEQVAGRYEEVEEQTLADDVSSDLQASRDPHETMGAEEMEVLVEQQSEKAESEMGSSFVSVGGTQAKRDSTVSIANPLDVSSVSTAVPAEAEASTTSVAQHDDETVEELVQLEEESNNTAEAATLSTIVEAQATSSFTEERVEVSGGSLDSSFESVGMSDGLPVSPITRLSLVSPTGSSSTTPTAVASPDMSLSRKGISLPRQGAVSPVPRSDQAEDLPSSPSVRGPGHPLSTDSPPPKMTGLSRSSKKKDKKGRRGHGHGRRH